MENKIEVLKNKILEATLFYNLGKEDFEAKFGFPLENLPEYQEFKKRFEKDVRSKLDTMLNRLISKGCIEKTGDKYKATEKHIKGLCDCSDEINPFEMATIYMIKKGCVEQLPNGSWRVTQRHIEDLCGCSSYREVAKVQSDIEINELEIFSIPFRFTYYKVEGFNNDSLVEEGKIDDIDIEDVIKSLPSEEQIELYKSLIESLEKINSVDKEVDFSYYYCNDGAYYIPYNIGALGQHELCIRWLSFISKINSGAIYPELYILYGQSYHVLGKTKEAIEYWITTLNYVSRQGDEMADWYEQELISQLVEIIEEQTKKIEHHYPEHHQKMVEKYLEVVEKLQKKSMKSKTRKDITGLIKECDEKYTRKYGRYLIKPTHPISEYSILEEDIGKNNWEDFITYLYNLLCENKIKDKIKEINIDKTIIEEINSLRIEFSHDLEHGEVDKKQEKLGRIYKKYTGKLILSDLSDEEIEYFSQQILSSVIGFLTDLKANI